MKKGSKVAITLALAVATTSIATGAAPFEKVYAAEKMVTAAVVHAEKKFTDITPKHWAYESIYWGVDQGLVVGYTDGTYRPSQQITEQEFATVLARFVKNIDNAKLKAPTGVWWSQPAYDELAKFQLPLKGYNNKEAKSTALTRGEIARLIAAKNGFNLTERQAIYYMYENDISNGLLSGELTFESYGADKAVNREQIPAFFKRLAEKGHTTFMGKTSEVVGNEIGGIVGIPQDKTEITDKMFDDLAKEKGITNPTKPSGTLSGKIANGDFSGGKSIADKYGGKFDSYSRGFEIIKDGKTLLAYHQGSREGLFSISMDNYDKQLLTDTLKLTGKFSDNEITKVIEIIEKEHFKNKIPQLYEISKDKLVEPSGGITGKLYLQFGVNN